MGRRLSRFFPALLALAVVGSAAGDHVKAAAAYYSHEVDARQRSEQKPFSSEHKPAAATKENPLTAEFGDFVREQLDKWKVPGIAVAVVDGDEVYAEVRFLLLLLPFPFLSPFSYYLIAVWHMVIFVSCCLSFFLFLFPFGSDSRTVSKCCV